MVAGEGRRREGKGTEGEQVMETEGLEKAWMKSTDCNVRAT